MHWRGDDNDDPQLRLSSLSCLLSDHSAHSIDRKITLLPTDQYVTMADINNWLPVDSSAQLVNMVWVVAVALQQWIRKKWENIPREKVGDDRHFIS